MQRWVADGPDEIREVVSAATRAGTDGGKSAPGISRNYRQQFRNFRGGDESAVTVDTGIGRTMQKLG
jgi:hypothetical protein